MKKELPRGLNIIRDKTNWVVYCGKKWTGGKPKRLYFKTKAEAEKEAARMVKDQKADIEATRATGFTEDQLAEIRTALNRSGGASLLDAVMFYNKRKPTITLSFAESCDEVWEAKKRGGMSDRHLKDLKEQFAFFKKVVGNIKLADFTNEHAEKIIQHTDARGNIPSASREAKRFRYLRIIFKRYKKQLKDSPLDGVETKKDRGETSRVEYLSPQNAARLIFTAQHYFPNLLLPILLKLFSGMRNPELYHLRWEMIGEETIEVLAAHAKTGKTRSITITPVLAEWLKTIERPENENQPVYNNRETRKDRGAAWILDLRELAKMAGVRWHQNYLRHSFGSYYFHLTKKESKTAWEMGNSPGVVKSNYTRAVKNADCRAYWDLIPRKVERIANYPLPENAPSGAMEVDEHQPTTLASGKRRRHSVAAIPRKRSRRASEQA